jgi:hypothetical protein
VADAGDRKSFWTTLPGILTGIAAVIIAITGLVGALYAAGIIGGSTPTSTPTPPATPTPTSVPIPAATPTPTSPQSASAVKFNIGDRVQVYNTGTSGLVVRDAPCGSQIGDKFDEAGGRVIGGPTFCNGSNRWQIRWFDGFVGWSAEDWLRGVPVTLTVNCSGGGTLSPQGCGTTRSYNQGTSVTLTTSPTSGWQFGGVVRGLHWNRGLHPQLGQQCQRHRHLHPGATPSGAHGHASSDANFRADTHSHASSNAHSFRPGHQRPVALLARLHRFRSNLR